MTRSTTVRGFDINIGHHCQLRSSNGVRNKRYMLSARRLAPDHNQKGINVVVQVTASAFLDARLVEFAQYVLDL